MNERYTGYGFPLQYKQDLRIKGKKILFGTGRC